MSKPNNKVWDSTFPFFYVLWLNSSVRRKGTEFTLAFKGES